MTLLFKAVEEKKLDVRVVERNLDRGLLKSEEFQKSEKELPDDAANAEYVNIESLAADDSGSNSNH